MNARPPRPRVAVIGISGYGRIHLELARACRDRGELDLVAATVINREEEAANVAELEGKGTAIYTDHAEMLRRHAGAIDLCLIPTGIHWHAPMTVAALQAGANVLVEKPLAGSTAEVAAIRAAERASGRFAAVGFQDYYEPGTTWLKGELARGAIGELRSVRFLGLWPRTRAYYRRNDWAGRLQAGGRPVFDSPLNNAFAHFVMLSLYFAGANGRAATGVRLEQAELFRAHDIASFDTAVARLATDEGVALWFGATHASRTSLEPEILITGSAGTACWRYESEAWWEDARGRRERRRLLDANGARREMMAATLRRLRDPAASICTTEMAGCHTALIESLHRQTEIVTLAPSLVTWSGDPGDAMATPSVRGLDEALQRACATQSPLADAGFPPGVPAGRR
ncbi:MAG TPA: Gfo/Idh/MocA family oxidoreductase [Opitutaceae bacterium]|nr:Gfo/Idh/MocA family oxidoreductase [Opitutaceae bacterium]